MHSPPFLAVFVRSGVGGRRCTHVSDRLHPISLTRHWLNRLRIVFLRENSTPLPGVVSNTQPLERATCTIDAADRQAVEPDRPESESPFSGFRTAVRAFFLRSRQGGWFRSLYVPILSAGTEIRNIT